MKALCSLVIIAAATVSVSAHAFGLESFYGRVTQKGHIWTCVYENTTGAAQNMKYVVFNFDGISGDSAPMEVQNRIDQVVRPGETLRATGEHAHAVTVNYCKYLAR